MNLFLFGLSKTETAAKNAPPVPKLGYFDRQVPILSSQVTLATSGAGVVSHILNSIEISRSIYLRNDLE